MTRLLRMLANALGRLPPRVARRVAVFGGWVFGAVLRYHRRDAQAALQRSYPEQSAAAIRDLVRRMYVHLVRNGLDLCRVGVMNDAELRAAADLEGWAHLEAALARGRGALILTAHLGNWDLLCTLTPTWGYPLTIITKNLRQAGLNRFWMQSRERFGLRFVPAHRSFRACLKALRKNELVGFVLDQNMIDREGVFVDFFGRPACTTPGLAYLAAQSGAPVVPVFLLRGADGRHHGRILPLLEPPPDRAPDTIRAATQQYTRIIEDAIREHPEQWIWLHRRWKTQPPAAPAAPA